MGNIRKSFLRQFLQKEFQLNYGITLKKIHRRNINPEHLL